MSKVACLVGSRNITNQDRERIRTVGELLFFLHYIGRSGNAEGVDQEWDKYLFVQHILPWNGFNGAHNGDCDYQYLALNFAPEELRTKAEAIAIEHHPYGDTLREGPLKLHTRNVFQPLGLKLSPETYAELTIYCAPESPYGVVKGGTATAVSISRTHGIPTYNLRDDDQYQDLLNKLWAELEEM
ncbi:hypothetical protein vBValSX1_101 [Vibrio phage vB_ValS_X1]|uniref:Uncharacterized protein n=1 Tax=Vibrio phage vB_ValS_X1 TaxID=2736341 RepID=A0A6M9Z9K2_9CAUD|nr:hypothetical protein vBValSX1_101 [Vibrio phage vB_ValS_X1]